MALKGLDILKGISSFKTVFFEQLVKNMRHRTIGFSIERFYDHVLRLINL